jgi:hypothetical protein
LRKGRTVVSPIEKSNSVYVVTGGEYALVIASGTDIDSHLSNHSIQRTKNDLLFETKSDMNL